MQVARKVLVLHLRGTPRDVNGQAVHSEAQEILTALCSPQQCLHLHSKATTVLEVEAWRGAFPEAYFSFIRYLA